MRWFNAVNGLRAFATNSSRNFFRFQSLEFRGNQKEPSAGACGCAFRFSAVLLNQTTNNWREKARLIFSLKFEDRFSARFRVWWRAVGEKLFKLVRLVRSAKLFYWSLQFGGKKRKQTDELHRPKMCRLRAACRPLVFTDNDQSIWSACIEMAEFPFNIRQLRKPGSPSRRTPRL